MLYLLFFIYLAFACFIGTRVSFLKNSGLTNRLLLILFFIKVAAGLVLGYISIHYYPGNDYEALNYYGQEEYKLLMKSPSDFLTSTFTSLYPDKYGHLFSATGSFWNDLEDTLLSKLLAIFNIFSRGNYYINSLFFNCIGFFAPVALFRMFDNIYTQKKDLLILGCFLIPSTLYFSSGLHKDAIIFTAMAFYLYSFYFSVYKKFTTRRVILLIISFIVILLLRNFIGLILLPLSVLFIVTQRMKWKPLLSFGIFFGIVVLVLILLPSETNPLSILVRRRADFEAISTANSALPVMHLEPSVLSMLKNFPAAVSHVFLLPYPWSLQTIWLLPFVLEMLA
ncbi:MAG: hypothetical protein ABIY51_06010, partial [Ferruginibacter sp.]